MTLSRDLTPLHQVANSALKGFGIPKDEDEQFLNFSSILGVGLELALRHPEWAAKTLAMLSPQLTASNQQMADEMVAKYPVKET